MLEQEMLREQFQCILDRQRQALKVYTDLAGASLDASIRQQAQEIQRDKQRHIRLTERLIEIVE